MRYSCLLAHPSGATMARIVELEPVEIRSIENLRALRGTAEADLVAQTYALRKAYAGAPAGYLHFEPPTAVRPS
jgi:hypothetical protein